MKAQILLLMLGLAISSAGLTAVVAYAIGWSSGDEDAGLRTEFMTWLTLDGNPIEVAVVLAVDPKRHWIECAETAPIEGGKFRLVTRHDPMTDVELPIRYRRDGSVSFARPTVHA
jgi:hypothetical protein